MGGTRIQYKCSVQYYGVNTQDTEFSVVEVKNVTDSLQKRSAPDQDRVHPKVLGEHSAEI